FCTMKRCTVSYILYPTHPPHCTGSPPPVPPVWDVIKEEEFDEGEFVELFARTAPAPHTKPPTTRTVKIKVAKVLDSKRSQNVGIFITSQHLDIVDVENAVYNLDTTLLDLEVLQQIYEVRGTPEEILLIRAQVEADPDLPLDKPEQFLLELSRMNEFSERLSCILFRASFGDLLQQLRAKLQLLLSTMQHLMTSQPLKRVFGLILALGNYMNGGNRQRGQADGFGLEILPKLKDVKSSQNSFTLLHFIVIKYIQKYEGEDAGTDKVELPTPDPYVAEKVANFKFEDLQAELKSLAANLKDCEVRVGRVVERSDEAHREPFQGKMNEFLASATTDLQQEGEALRRCQKKFDQVVKYFQFSNRGKEVTPYDFFSVWSPFCRDFATIWTLEQRRVAKERMKAAMGNAKRLKTATNPDIVTKPPQATGLKSKFRRRKEGNE
ncbi:formin, partial [Hyalella azteca]|uniref:Formin n=2 Tax=Hyalella azteca TaxID=294128 RepID=A0A8B7NHQ3_HYAAZ